jgi:hypothetical protein
MGGPITSYSKGHAGKSPVPFRVTKVAWRLLVFPCRNFSVRPREYQRRISDHTPLDGVFRLEHGCHAAAPPHPIRSQVGISPYGVS